MVLINLALTNEALQFCTVTTYHSMTSFAAEVTAIARRSRGMGLSAAPSIQYRFYLFHHACKDILNSSSSNIQGFLFNDGDRGSSREMDSGDGSRASGSCFLGGCSSVSTLQNSFGSFKDLIYLIGVLWVMIRQCDF